MSPLNKFIVSVVILVSTASWVLFVLYFIEKTRLEIFGITTIRNLSGHSNIVRGESGFCRHIDDDERAGRCKNFNRCASRTYALNESGDDHFKNENFEPVHNCVYNPTSSASSYLMKQYNQDLNTLRCSNNLKEIKESLKLGIIKIDLGGTQNLGDSHDEKIDPYFRKDSIKSEKPQLTQNGFFYNLYFNQLLSSINYKLQTQEAYQFLKDTNEDVNEGFEKFWEAKLLPSNNDNILEIIDPLYGDDWTLKFRIKSRTDVSTIECEHIPFDQIEDSIFLSLINNLKQGENTLRNDFETNGLAFSYDNFLDFILQDTLCSNFELQQSPK